ncbi:MAG: hypothetical protein GY768_00085 [Planctomycetaceae bacterium]|nr:hypothetical protein [Planctomycetaceae bacterium]
MRKKSSTTFANQIVTASDLNDCHWQTPNRIASQQLQASMKSDIANRTLDPQFQAHDLKPHTLRTRFYRGHAFSRQVSCEEIIDSD